MGLTYVGVRNYIRRNAKVFTYSEISEIPEKQGIYFAFEEGQFDTDGKNRIVRVGKTGNLNDRIREHFSGKVDGSAFRKHVMSSLNTDDENEISNYIQGNVSFAVICVPKVLSCDELERSIISMLAQYSKGIEVSNWIGLNCQNEAVKKYKIWNHQVHLSKDSSDLITLDNYLQDILEIGLVKK